jgi:hypothetical protein
MAEPKVWTAEELLAMSPNERDRVIRAGLITDPSQIPPAVTERARRKAQARIAETEGNRSPQ